MCGRTATAQPNVPPKPNVLWILGEDLGPELGIYGTPEVETPRLDALAQQGMLFTNAFTTSPVCSSSRSAFNTGMYQGTIGAHNHRSHRADDPSPYPWYLPEGVQTISDWMRHAGYFTGNIRTFPDDVPFNGTGKTDWNFTYRGEPFDTEVWSELKDHQPFYAQVNFPETHRGNAWDTAHERIDRTADPDEVVLPPYYPDHPIVREDWAQYLNTVMALDKKVGTVLDLLERDGLSENTIVIFMGDHGRAMVRGKQWPYDSGLSVPLIIYVPPSLGAFPGYEPGARIDRLVAAIDVTATTLALAGIPKPPKMQGRIFLGPSAEPPRRYVFGGRDRGDETVDRIRTVRTSRYRYIRNFYPERPFLQTNRYKEGNYATIWVLRKLAKEDALTPVQAQMLAPTRPGEELYDIIADPYEIENLAESQDHQEIVAQLRGVLDRWIQSSDDQGQIPEDPAVQAYYEERSHRHDEEIEEMKRKVGIDR